MTPSRTAFAALLGATLLAGCVTTRKPDPLAYTHGEFAQTNTDTYSRNYPLPPGNVCEGGRRALLSQGYTLAASSSATTVEGHKQFQNSPDNHREITFYLVCEPDHANSAHSVAFVNAVESAYTLKKVTNSASVGVGLLGSLAMPIGSTDDSMVKVGSETIASATFYSRFFNLLERYAPPPKAEPVPVSVPEPVKPVELPKVEPPAAGTPQAEPDSHQLDSAKPETQPGDQAPRPPGP